MVHQKYLLIIDDTPLDKRFEEYFAQFDFKIIQKSRLPQISNSLKPPAAILINWLLIQADPATIDAVYQQYSTPIIVISDTNNEEICAQLLEAGADDFIIKPINPRELHARISAITRRVQRANQTSSQGKEVLLFDKWRLYPTSRQLFDENNELLLSAKEYDLLLAFLRQPQHVLDLDFLSQISQGADQDPLDRRIAVQICRLRQKIEVDARKPTLIKTIRNNGYIFTAQVISTKE